MQVVAALLGIVAGVCWLVAVASFVMSVVHRAPNLSVGAFLVRGTLMFDPSNFTELGKVHQRRFLAAFAAFFGTIFLSVLLLAAAGAL